jgi:hypothetical protein
MTEGLNFELQNRMFVIDHSGVITLLLKKELQLKSATQEKLH